MAAGRRVVHLNQNGAVIARNPKDEVAFHSATGAIDSDWRSRIDKRFTSLRGGAALIVMLAHYQYIGFMPALPAFKYSGQCGLMVFFFLSSFLLCHSLASDPNWAARHLPHFSAAWRRDRADLLERIVVLSTLHHLLGGAEAVAHSRPGAGRSLDDSRRTYVLPLPADRPGAGVAGDAIASRRCGAGVGFSRVVHRDRCRAA
jgi:hypothetical protein